jgi:hypothetical protein
LSPPRNDPPTAVDGEIVKSVVALALVLHGLPPATAIEADEDCAAPVADVRVDLGDADDDAALATYLRRRLAARTCATASTPPRAAITVDVRWHDEARGVYQVRVGPGDIAEHTCDCSSPEIVDWVASVVPDAVPPPASPAPIPARPPLTAKPETTPAVPPPIVFGHQAPAGRRRPPSRRHRAARALLAAGGPVAIGGAGMWATGYASYAPQPRLRVALRPAGIATTVTGVVALATAGLLWALRRGHRHSKGRPEGGRINSQASLSTDRSITKPLTVE